MPKEYIKTARSPEHHGWPDHAVRVGWQRSGIVNIATVRLGAAEGSTDPGDGLFADLDREGVNRLIRTLRKARDQAYGADA